MNTTPQAPRPAPPSASARHDAIRRRAEQIFIRSGGIPGRDLDNWAQAEQEILGESPSPRAAIVIRINGTEFVGEYNPAASGGYRPGELSHGVAVPVRFLGDKMFVKRPNGQDLETTLISKITEASAH
jgi:hypothetical protein